MLVRALWLLASVTHNWEGFAYYAEFDRGTSKGRLVLANAAGALVAAMIRCAACTRLMSADEFRSWLGVGTCCSTPSPDEVDRRHVESLAFDDAWQDERDQVAEMRGLVE